MLFITIDIGLKKEINISSILFALCSIASLRVEKIDKRFVRQNFPIYRNTSTCTYCTWF